MTNANATSSEAAERRRAADVAAGAAGADVVFRGGRVVDVFSGRIRRADVAVAGTRIAAVGDVSACTGPETEAVDCDSLFVLPGFVEPHLHVGGSQVAIERLAEVLVPRGTVAVSTCFYEPAFIAGLDAALALLERAQGTGLDILLSPFHAAALGIGQFGNLDRFDFDDLERLLLHDACVELREWNYWVDKIPVPAIERIYERALERGRTLGGHLEGLPPELVQASAALGVRNDHETGTVGEALERVRAGVTVQVREGSGARDLVPVLAAITEEGADTRWFSFSTDEQELSSLVEDGHIDHKLRLAVAEGVPPIDAVRMATLNSAVSLGVDDDYGAVAPGRYASLAVVEDLASFDVRLVASRGRVLARDGKYIEHIDAAEYPESWRTTVKVDRGLQPEDFRLRLATGQATVRVIGITPGSLVTEELVEAVSVREGRLESADGLAKIAVVDRYDGGRQSMCGLVRGLGVRRGAIAATVNPGMMNLMVVGADDADMVVAANRVVELGGGIAVAGGGRIAAEVALPIFGILSDEPLERTAASCVAIERAIAAELGSPVTGLLTSAGFACLAVSIPRLKICAAGLVRVSRNGHEPVSLELDGGG
jgi:adenine deaminase